MPALTSELGLQQGVDDDDTADYLTAMLAPSLSILDGLFNASTGHNHSGAHQGAPIVASSVRGPYDFADWIRSTARTSPLPTSGVGLEMYWDSAGNAGMVQSYDRVGSAYRDTRVRGSTVSLTNGAGQSLVLGTDGTTTIPGNLTAPGGLTVSSLSVTNNLVVGGNATVSGVLTVGSINGTGGLTIGGNASFTGVVYATQRLVVGGSDYGHVLNTAGNGVAANFWYQRAGSGRCWDNVDFTYGVGIAGNTLVQRDGSGQVQAQAVYIPTGNQPGKPTSVLGQTGDGYTRWWPTNAIGPPISAWYAQANMTLPALSGGGGIGNATFAVVAATGGFVVSGTTITVPRPGWYSVAGGFNGSNNTGNSETMSVQLIASGHGVIDSLGVPIKISSFLGGYFSWEGYLDQGETIRLQFQTSFDAIGGNGEILVSFVPIAQYNQ